MRRPMAWIRFMFERALLRGLQYRLMLAVAVVTTVAVVGGAMVVLFDPSISQWDEGVWWAFLRLTDPGYLGDDEGLVRRFVSTVVTVLGYLLFLGLFIAILTQWLEYTISKVESGATPVVLSNHVIILGWTHRTPTIVSELLRTGPRAQRFLERHGARTLRVVVLAEHVDGELIRELRERLGDVWNDRQVLLRSGNPLRVEDLERVAFRDAAVLILPGAGFAVRNPEYVDAETVKTLMAVSKAAHGSGTKPPLAVVELYDGRRAAVARRVYGGDCEIVVADEIVSRIIAQSVRNHGLCGVFTELFTLNHGNAVYLQPLDGAAGTKFGDLRGRYAKAILLGTVRPDERRPTLSPDPETVLAADDLLVFIARSSKDCAHHAASRPAALTPIEPPTRAESGRRRVLILGWSRRVPALLWELERHGRDLFEVDIVSSTPIEEREEMLSRYGREVSNDRVRQVQAGYTLPGVLNRLEPQSYDNIVLLASERLREEEQADAITVFTYQLLTGLLPEKGPRPAVFVELLDEENQALLEQERDDVIVSPSLVSYLLSQVSLRSELAAIFAELSRPRGAQVLLENAQDYLAMDKPQGFEDVERAAMAHGEIALGVLHAAGAGTKLALNPDRAAQWTPAPGDKVVVLVSAAGGDSEK